MTTAYAYLAQSASIAGTATAGLVSFTIRKRVRSKADLRSDGEIYDRKAPITSVEEGIDIELRNAAAAPVMGATGATSLVGVKHSGGVNLSGSLTCTAALTTVESVEHTIDLDGKPVVRVSLSVQSADGLASGISWASA